MVAFRAGDHSRALRLGSNALALDPSNRVLQQFMQLLTTMVDDDSGMCSHLVACWPSLLPLGSVHCGC